MHGKPHLDAMKLDHARLAAARIDADPTLIKLAHEHLERACQLRRWLSRAQTEWLQILARYRWPEVRAILVQETDEGQRLRGSSPFTGFASEAERHAIQARHPPPGAPRDWKPLPLLSREELERRLGENLTRARVTYQRRTFALAPVYEQGGWLVEATNVREALEDAEAAFPALRAVPRGDLMLWTAAAFRRRQLDGAAFGPEWKRQSPRGD